MKIGILRYPYFRQAMKGGDHVLFDSIIEALQEEHQIGLVEFRRPFGRLVTLLPATMAKVLMRLVDLLLPFLYGWQLRSSLSTFDMVIADSAAVTKIPFCPASAEKMILLINIDYHAYLDAVGSFLPLHSRAIMRWKSWMQDRGLATYRSVAVSHFVGETVGARSMAAVHVIQNRVQGLTWQAGSGRPPKGMVYAGSGDYFGKGLDMLQALAGRGLAIHTYSPARIAGCTNHGPVQRDVLLDALPCYEVMIFPSRYESFGLVVIEALASGVPVIMRRTGIGIDLAKVLPCCVLPPDATVDDWESAVHLIARERAGIVETGRAFARNYVENSTFSADWREKIGILCGSAC